MAYKWHERISQPIHRVSFSRLCCQLCHLRCLRRRLYGAQGGRAKVQGMPSTQRLARKMLGVAPIGGEVPYIVLFFVGSLFFYIILFETIWFEQCPSKHVIISFEQCPLSLSLVADSAAMCESLFKRAKRHDLSSSQKPVDLQVLSRWLYRFITPESSTAPGGGVGCSCLLEIGNRHLELA